MKTHGEVPYGPVLTELLGNPGLSALTVGTPHKAMHARLLSLAGNEMFAPHTIHDEVQAAACRSGLWLYFDFFDEAHRICQDLHTAEGSYWHAILHRREPDPDNAKYWFRRVGTHPVFEPLRAAAAELARDTAGPAAFLVRQTRWDPFALVDLCETARAGQVDCSDLCLAIQRREWQLLFQHCYRKATGRTD